MVAEAARALGTFLRGKARYRKSDLRLLIQQAGADALELNVYFLGSDPDESGVSIEERTIKMVKAVREAVRIPVAVKLSPYYTSLAQFTGQLDDAGADIEWLLKTRSGYPEPRVEAARSFLARGEASPASQTWRSA